MNEPSERTTYTRCSGVDADGEQCTEELPDHSWGRIKSGWFEQKDGRIWCPAHTPAWVADWRGRKRRGT